MAVVKRYVYDFDPTGRSSVNLIKNERHTITPENRTPQNVLIPGYAPFFRQSLVVTDMATGLPLQEGIDYTVEWPIVSTSDDLEGYTPVYGGIQFIDEEITGQFELQYQTIGGQWALDGVAVAQALANQANDPLTTTFEEIIGKPIKLPPLEHVHAIEDFVGFEDLCNAVDRLGSTLELLIREDKDSHPGYETLVDVYFLLQDLVNGLTTKTDKTNEKLASEITRVTNDTNSLIDALRVEKNNDIRNLNTDLTNRLNTLKQETTTAISNLNNDLTNKLNQLRTDTNNGFDNIRNSLNTAKNELLTKINEDRARLTSIETKNTQQDNRLQVIDNKNTEQDTRLTNIETKNTQQDAKLAELNNKFDNYVLVKPNTPYGELSTKYAQARNSFISGSINSTQATELGAPKLANMDYNGLIMSNDLQTTQLLIGGANNVYLRVHDDQANPTNPWQTTEIATKSSIDSILAELGNVVFTTRDQNVNGHKTFVQPIRFKNTTSGSTNANTFGKIGFNDNDVYIHNPLSNKYLAMKTNGELHYGGKQIIWKEGNYLRNNVAENNYGGFELTRPVGSESQYWRFEVIPNNDSNKAVAGSFKLFRSSTTNGVAEAKKRLAIYFQNKDGTVALTSDITTAKNEITTAYNAAIKVVSDRETNHYNELVGKINTTNNNVTSLNNKVTSLTGTVNNLTTTVNGNKTDYTNKYNDVSNRINNLGTTLQNSYVTLSTEQNITGIKNFNNKIRLKTNGATVEVYSVIQDGRHSLRAEHISAADYYVSSDRRLKEDIKPISDALNIVSKLNGYTYKFKNSGKYTAGVIAQELQELLPNLVAKDNSEDEFLSVQYDNIVPYLIEAIKTLKAEVDELKRG